MHQCLTIVEVQRTIFREVYRQDTDLVTLARLARTCRAFNSVALDVLWVTLDSFVLLVKCLPRDLWKIDPVDRKMVFQRPMSFKDWKIFFRYSSRIRNLCQSVGPEIITQCSSLGDDVIFALSNPPAYGPLVPYLRMLDWDKPNGEYASLLRLLLTPSLVNLTLSSCSLRSPEVSILTSIGAVCPSLKTFRIYSRGLSANALDAQGQKVLSEVLLHLHSLESLSCPALDETAIVHLSRLLFLHELSFGLQDCFQPAKVRAYMAPPAFASIYSLTLHTNALSTLTSLLESMSFKPTDVSFNVANTPTTDALRLFFFALASACGSERLSRISLVARGARLPNPPLQRVTLSTFLSLFAFPNISSFEFDVPCDVALDDDAIRTFAKHWSGVNALSINAKSGWGFPIRTTHHGLIALLSSCPMLSLFALAFNFSDVDKPHRRMAETRPGAGVVSKSCLVANFVTSTIRFPVTIAAFLSDVCPGVPVVESAWETGLLTDADPEEVGVYRERWEEVGNLLPAFTAVRKQSMKWAEEKAKEGNIENA